LHVLFRSSVLHEVLHHTRDVEIHLVRLPKT
jgi:hypothetical protein